MSEPSVQVKKIVIDLGDSQGDLILEMKTAKKLYDVLKDLFEKIVQPEADDRLRFRMNPNPNVFPGHGRPFYSPIPNITNVPNAPSQIWATNRTQLRLDALANTAYLSSRANENLSESSLDIQDS